MILKNQAPIQPTSGRFEVKLFRILQLFIHSSDFLEVARRHPADFSRRRCLPVSSLILFLLNQVKGSLQSELNLFFQDLYGFSEPIRVITKGAFTRARSKLRPEALSLLLRKLLSFFYQNGDPALWNGFRLLAVDGSTVKLPFIDALAQFFGSLKCSKGQRPRPMARVSQLFDVLNKVSVDVILAPYRNAEKTLAAQHAQHVGAGDLILADRGYPAFWFANLLGQRGADFCFRVQKDFKVIRLLNRLGLREALVYWRPTNIAKAKCRSMGLPTTPLLVRVIRIEPTHGKPIYLLTSLLDTKALPYTCFGALYHLRWRVEEDYKVLKERMELANFTGRTVHAIQQDFIAKAVTKNLTAITSAYARQEIQERSLGRKHEVMLNFTQALSLMKSRIVRLLSSDPEVLLAYIHQAFTKMVEIVRPGRRFPRYRSTRKPVKLKDFHFCYKRTL